MLAPFLRLLLLQDTDPKYVLDASAWFLEGIPAKQNILKQKRELVDKKCKPQSASLEPHCSAENRAKQVGVCFTAFLHYSLLITVTRKGFIILLFLSKQQSLFKIIMSLLKCGFQGEWALNGSRKTTVLPSWTASHQNVFPLRILWNVTSLYDSSHHSINAEHFCKWGNALWNVRQTIKSIICKLPKRNETHGCQ